MGCRAIDHLKNNPDYRVRPVEVSPEGQAQLTRRGFRARPAEDAVPGADVVILAVPDRILPYAAEEIVPLARSGALFMILDPAAAAAGQLPDREDVSYFVSHGCHPSVFEHFRTQAEIDDFYGGSQARQAIVCALYQGPEEHYVLGERVAREIHAPVTRSHRITVEQMAILEPTLGEVCCNVLVTALREAMEEAIHRGVPREAAQDYLFGHIKIPLGIAFERVPHQPTEEARLVAEYARHRILQPDWKDVFHPRQVREQVKAILSGRLPPTA